jgi:hypothetical protein
MPRTNTTMLLSRDRKPSKATETAREGGRVRLKTAPESTPRTVENTSPMLPAF